MAAVLAADTELCSNETVVLTMDEPLTAPAEAAKDSVQISSANPPTTIPKFLNAPQDTLFKNLSIPVPALPSTSNPNAPMNLINFAPQDTVISMPEDQAAIAPQTSTSYALDVANPEMAIEESKSRVAVRFLLKKSKRFCGAIRFYLSKPAAAHSSKFKSLMSTLKDSVKSTLASGLPSSQTISEITSSLVSTLKGQRLPNCLRFLGFSLTSIKQRSKKNRSHENKSNKSNKSSSSIAKGKTKSKTFLNWWKKPEPEPEGGHQFVKPKIYECSYCQTKFFKLPVYLKHIRRHAQLIRCENCGKAFNTIINKRRHQLQCSHRAIL